ncbi:MAG: ATP-binding cassette domain-containing protein [Chloroflexi bacterium]|nr:ATP-binding cassette domain-containing protein [Chloroflexota bacterium]
MIEADDLRKTFRVHRRRQDGLLRMIRREAVDVAAVAGVSFTVAPGEMVGYVGPNGAGKSTTIKMLTGILQPSGGHVRVAGLDPASQRLEVAKRIGVVFGQRSQLWWDLPLVESFELLRHIYRVPAEAYRQRLGYLAELLELGSFMQTPVRQLSLGQRMRGDLTAALLHAPPVLFLDEPSIGLDVVAKARIRELLAQINRDQGVTMLLTTHDMADIERLCSRMLIIDRGRVIYDGSLDTIRAQYGDERTVVVDLEEAAPPLTIPGATVSRTDGPRQWLRFRRSETTAAQIIAEVAAAARLRDLTIEEPAIEDIVREVYEHGIGASA